jgi:predicted amidohydrolase
VTQHFGEMDSDIAEKCKYAKVWAARIGKAIQEGVQLLPPPELSEMGYGLHTHPPSRPLAHPLTRSSKMLSHKRFDFQKFMIRAYGRTLSTCSVATRAPHTPDCHMPRHDPRVMHGSCLYLVLAHFSPQGTTTMTCDHTHD